jgi:hypothetical protein
MNITIPQLRTSSHQKSFLPQTIADWNNLEDKIKKLPSIESFKDNLKKISSPKPNPLFHHDCSKAAIHHTRIRLGLSGLCSHRFNYKHIQDPKCPTCDAKCEDPAHFFLTCPTYSTQRHTFLPDICEILFANNIEVDFMKRPFRTFFINMILKGSQDLTLQENERIFSLTKTYILDSHRFI